MNRLLSLLALFTVAAFAACGGKVVVDLPGNGGAGGTGGGSPSTGTFPDTGPTTGTGPSDLCAQLCTFWDQAMCTMPDCAQQCAQVFQTAGPCLDELTAAIQCILANPDPAGGCAMPAACTKAVGVYQSCVTPGSGCTQVSCASGSDGSCACKGVCNDLSIVVECKGSLCKCNANGMQIGLCKEESPSCDPLGGCCADVFFPKGG